MKEIWWVGLSSHTLTSLRHIYILRVMWYKVHLQQHDTDHDTKKYWNESVYKHQYSCDNICCWTSSTTSTAWCTYHACLVISECSFTSQPLSILQCQSLLASACGLRLDKVRPQKAPRRMHLWGPKSLQSFLVEGWWWWCGGVSS